MKIAIKLPGFFIPASVCLCLALLMAGCATPTPSQYDPEIKAAAEAAQVSFLRGEVARADTLYAKALTRARLTDNREEVVRNSYNLALCRMTLGQLGEVSNLLVQAGMLTSTQGLIAARILLAESETARMSGDGPASEALAGQALVAGTDREGAVQARLLQGEARLKAGQLQGALESFHAATKRVTRDTPAIIRARLDDLETALVQARLRPGSIASIQLRRADWLKKAGQFNEMVKALQAAATTLELESKWAEAFDCRIRAGQSLLASGEVKRALLEARKADELADKTGNKNNKTLAGSLLNELK